MQNLKNYTEFLNESFQMPDLDKWANEMLKDGFVKGIENVKKYLSDSKIEKSTDEGAMLLNKFFDTCHNNPKVAKEMRSTNRDRDLKRLQDEKNKLQDQIAAINVEIESVMVEKAS